MGIASSLLPEVDLSKPLGQRLEIKIQKDASPKELYELIKKEKIKRIQSSYVDSFYLGMYSKEEMIPIIKSYYKEILERISDDSEFIEQRQGNLDQIREKIDKIDSLDYWNLAPIYSNIKNIENFWVQKETGELPNNMPTYCQSDECLNLLKIKIAKDTEGLNKTLDDLKSTSNQELVDDFVEQCRVKKLINNQNYYNKVKSDFEKLIPEIKKQLAENVFSKLSTDSKKNFFEYVNGLRESYMGSLDTVLSNSFSIEQQIDMAYSSRALNNFGDIKDISNFRVVSMVGMFNVNGEVNPLSGNSLTQICGNSLGNDINDSYSELTSPEGNGIVNISKFSCEHTHYGESIVAHELGHMISDYFEEDKLSSESLLKYKNFRLCVGKFNVDPITPQAIYNRFSGDTQKSEEDSADYIMSQFFMSKSDKPVGCALMDPSETGSSYNIVSIYPEEFDSHSRPLIRAIRERYLRGGNIPHACQKIIDGTKDYYRFNSCEF